MTDIKPEVRAVDSSPPSKECETALLFEEHKPHTWFKARDTEKRYPWHCDGILPVEEQPPCQWYISPEQPECGDPSPTTVHVKTTLIEANIDVCVKHKGVYNSLSAARRQRGGRNVQQRRSA